MEDMVTTLRLVGLKTFNKFPCKRKDNRLMSRTGVIRKGVVQGKKTHCHRTSKFLMLSEKPRHFFKRLSH